MNPVQKPKNRRKKHTKSKYGCTQCKSKGTKCDEQLPICQRCTAKNIYCSYLDLSEDQIQIIRISHWEAAGSDPLTCPIPSQSFNPDKMIIVEQANEIHKTKRTWNHNDKKNTNNTTNTNNANSTNKDFYQSQIENQQSFLQYEHKDGWPNHENGEPTSPTPHLGPGLNSIEGSSPANLRVKLVPHNIKPPHFNPKNNFEFFGETLPVTHTRILLSAREYTGLLEASANILAFYGSLLQGIGPLIPRIGGLDVFYLKYKGLCMNYVIKNLKNVNDSNVQMLRLVITSLSSSSIYQKSGSFKDHFSFALGPASLIIEVLSNPERFPNSLARLKIHASGLLFTTKYIFMPQYKTDIISEFYEILKQFSGQFINRKMVKQEVVDQCESLIDFVDYSIRLLQNEKSQDEVAKYPIKKIYELIQRWYSIFPSECYTLGSTTPPIEKVFYVFWFALIFELESIIIGSRYIFTYSLHGYMMVYPFNKQELSRDIKDSALLWYFNYLCRIIAFFSRRSSYILRNTVVQNPIPLFSNEKDRFRTRALDIHERCISTFKDTLIKQKNYPMESSRSLNLEYADKNTKDGNHYAYKQFRSDEDENEGLESSLMEFVNLSGNLTGILNEEDNHIDLVNNINQETSLLNNDFDPRYTDPIFNERLAFEEADLQFMKRYYEDRRLILHLDEGFI